MAEAKRVQSTTKWKADSDPAGPARSAFGIEADRLEGLFDGGIAEMNFTANAADSALPRDFQKSRNQVAADPLASPLGCDGHGNDVHRLAAEFRAPRITGV